MVTSQYHLKRGTLLYYAQSLLSAAQYNKSPIEIVGNAGWLREDKTSEDKSHLSNSLAQILDVSSEFRSISYLPFSVLESISVTNPNKASYTLGEELDLTGMVATATYDTSYSRDVTDYITVTGYDSATLGTQTITVEYIETDLNTETDVTVSATFDVVVNAATISSTSGSSSTTESTPPAKTGDNDITLIAVVLLGAFSAGLVIYKKRKTSS